MNTTPRPCTLDTYPCVPSSSLLIFVLAEETGETGTQWPEAEVVEMVIEDNNIIIHPTEVDLGLAEQKKDCKPEIIPKNYGK